MKVNLTSYGLPRAGEPSEDAFAVKTWDETVIAVLADGTGAARRGREASMRIVESLVNNYAARPESWTPQKALTEFTRLINRTLHHESLLRHDSPEMVSTLSVAVIEGNRLYGLNVGDSRVYLSRGGRLARLSEDHVDVDMKHVLRRAIGLAPEVEPYCFERELSDGDVAFLCSDGVSNVLNDDDLGARLAQHAAARAIVQHARSVATSEQLDDMSAIVIDIAETGKLRAVSQLSLPIPDLLQKGGVIDGYELVRPFQHSDRVWLATKDGQRWTLKFAPLEARDSEAVLQQFIKETWNATRLRAEFFVEALVPEKRTAHYYVMEFVEAPSLRSLLKARPLAVDEAVALGKFLVDASQHLLRFDLVHGDIKPENILVITGYDRLSFKLVDLGSATEIFSITSRAGTASYLAPERFHNAPISERTEVFAIGVTLYETLTRAFPYGEIERFQTPVFHSAKAPTRLNPNLPPWLESLILRALAVDPERRYRHYSEVAFDLAHPEKVEPFFQQAGGAGFNALRFYQTGFFILLAVTVYLIAKLLHH
ncbi:MAG: bifunctional protein-serine/threonine kinase/phosphatase [Chthoniobacter sp.]|nr:bifunctional protein-serine/threonine kinase/phosphatase [Chthoniobacter sp.]